MIPIALATEDELSQAIALRLISELKRPHHVTHILRRNGFGYLKSKMDSWCRMAEHQIMMVLTDLDQANCLVEFRDQWLAERPLPAGLIFRIAVREVESWVLADHQALRELVGKVRSDDPYIVGVRVGQFNATTVRLVLDLRQAVKPQVFSLAPVLSGQSQFQHRLVLDLYPLTQVDPLEALIAEHAQGDKKNKDALEELIASQQKNQPASTFT
jgi:hypothetical protein